MTISLKIDNYLKAIILELDETPPVQIEKLTNTECSEKIFSILSHRKFTYLSRKQSEKYHSKLVKKILKDIKQKKPINLYLSLGGG